MRIVWGLAVLLVVNTASGQDVKSFGESMVTVATGSLAPIQMPDGSKLWRWAGKVPKGENVEARLVEMIAQTMGQAHWCPSGWEESKRTPATMGITVIEGRCR